MPEVPPELFVGVPGCGKTSLALARSFDASRHSGFPILVIDSQDTVHEKDADGKFAGEISGFEKAPTVPAAISRLWGAGLHTRFVPPRGESGTEAVNKLCAAVRAAGRAVLLIDEVAFWATAHGTPEELEFLLRVWRHSGAKIYMTTQYPGDVAPIVMTCVGRVFAFRCSTLAALDRLERTFLMDPDEIRNLPKFSFREWEVWQ